MAKKTMVDEPIVEKKKTTKVTAVEEPVASSKKDKKDKKTDAAPVVVEEEKKSKKEKKDKKDTKVEEEEVKKEDKKSKKEEKASKESPPAATTKNTTKDDTKDVTKSTKKATEPVEKKKTKHVPRDDSADFELTPSDPSWMTVDIKRLTRTRVMTFLARWIQDSVNESTFTKSQELVIAPFPHENYQLTGVKLQPPLTLPPSQKQEFENTMNARKWQEAIRFMLMWTNNPLRIPLDFTSEVSNPSDPKAKFMFTHDAVKKANVEFQKIVKQRKRPQLVKKKLDYNKKVQQFKIEQKWAPSSAPEDVRERLSQKVFVPRKRGGEAQQTEQTEQTEQNTMSDDADKETNNDDLADGKKDKKEKKDKKDKKDKKEKKDKKDKDDDVADDDVNPKKRKSMAPVPIEEKVEAEEPIVAKKKRTKA